MKILVLGAGAIGGYVGGRLVESGADVTFLVRDRRRDQLARDGLRIESQYGDAALSVKAIGAADVQPDHDLALLTCKAYDIHTALDAVAPGLAPRGVVLPVLNGLGHMDLLNDRFGRERVLGGTVKISVALTPEGVVKHLNDWRWITFGEQEGGMSERVERLRAAFAKTTGIEPRATATVMQEMWEKLVHLATAAGMTCLMRANVGQIVRTPDGAALFRDFLDISCEVARRCGYPPREDFVRNYRDLFSQTDSTYATSMLRDIEKGGPTEGDQIVGFMLAKARGCGVDDRLLTIAYTHLKAYEERRAGRSGPI